MKDLSLHILDIFQNSVSAKATQIELIFVEDTVNDVLKITIKDNGIGMSEEMQKQVTDPFFTTRTTRKVGLGIPLLKQSAEGCNGFMQIHSTLNKGTEVIVQMQYSHLDRKPIGDMASVVILTATSYPRVRFIYNHKFGDKEFCFDTDEVNSMLDGISIQNPNIVMMLKEMIQNNLDEIRN